MAMLTLPAFACPGVTPSFTLTTANNCGLPRVLNFTNTSTGTSASTARYFWKINNVTQDTINGTGSFSGLITTTGTFNIKLFVIDTSGCLDSSAATSVTVTTGAPQILDGNSTPSHNPIWQNCIVFLSDPDSFQIQVIATDTLNSYRIIWGDGTADATGATLLAGNSVNHTYINLGIYNIRIVTTKGACRDTIYGTIYNERQPTAGIIGPPSGLNAGCAPHTIRFINNSYNVSPTTSFQWDFGDGSVVTYGPDNAGDTVFHTYTTGVCNGIVTLTAINSCGTSTTTWNPININERDIAQIGVDNPNNCSPTIPHLFHNNSIDRYCLTPDPKLYFWDFGDGTTVGWTSSRASQNHVYDNPGFYRVMLLDSNRCGVDTTYFDLTVVRLPIPGIALLTDTIGCVPFTVSVADTSSGLFRTRLWNFGDPGSGAANTSTDSAETHTYNNPGTYTIRLSSTNACGTAFLERQIVVLPRPTPNFTTANSGCIPHTASFNNTSNTVSANARFHWNFGNGDTSNLRNPLPVQYNTPGLYTVKMIVYDTCGTDSITRNLNVYPLPVAYFRANRVCRGTATVFTDSSYLSGSFGSTTINSRRWHFGDGDSSTATNPTHTYANSGVYAVRLIVRTNRNCVDTFIDSVIVDASPTVSIGVTPGNNVCFGTTLSFDGTASTAPGTAITGYRWDFGDGNFAYQEDTVYNYASPGTYTVTFRVDINNGCFNTSTTNVVVSPLPQARITYTTACVGFPVFFIDSGSVSGAGNNIALREWDFNNDGIFDTTGLAPVRIFNTAGTFLIRLRETTNNNCEDEDTLSIIVTPKPVVNIGLLTANSLCAGDSFRFSNSSTGGVTYNWDFGDGTSISRPDTSPVAHAYTQAGSYSVRMIAISASGCIDSARLNVIARPLPQALFSPNDTLRCAPFNFEFQNQSTNGGIYRWFINGNLVSSDSLIRDTLIQQPGVTLQVRLIAENSFGCRPDTFEQIVRTAFDPVANFNLIPATGCGPLSVSTQNTSTNASTYRWDFGNGVQAYSTDTTVIFEPSLTQDTFYTVTLIAATGLGCQDTFIRNIQVFPRPAAAFNVNNDEGCGPLNVTFTNQSSPLDTGDISIMNFRWNFGNGIISQARDTSITFQPSLFGDTIYRVSLVAFSEHGCPDTTIRNILVHPLPYAAFDFVRSDSCGPFTVRTINQSYSRNTFTINPLQFFWNFGNGVTSNAVDTAVVFTAASSRDTSYNVQLTVTSEYGCVQSFNRTVTVYAKPDAGILQSETADCGPLFVQFNSNSRNFSQNGLDSLLTYIWDFGNGNQSLAKNPTQTFYASFYQDTVYTVKLTIRSQHGCEDSAFTTVTVYPNPISRFSAGPLFGCQPLVVNFSQLSLNAASYEWDFGDGTSSTAANPTHTFTSTALVDTFYFVKLKTTSSNGCPGDSMTIPIRVNPNPRIDFYPNADTLCPGDLLILSNASIGAIYYNWNIAGQTSTAINPFLNLNFQPSQDTTLSISLRGTTPQSCRDSLTKTITLLARPRANFSLAANAGCTPFTIGITNNSDLADSYIWDFGDGTQDTGLIPTHTYVNPSLATQHYRILLRVLRRGVCEDTISLPVSVYPHPRADFSSARVDFCDSGYVQFTNLSTIGSSYLWDFGDGSTSTQENPLHRFNQSYAQDTFYRVHLSTTTLNGCTDTISKLVRVTPGFRVSFTAPTSAGCAPVAVNFTNTSENALLFFWEFGDGTGSTLRNPSHTYTQTGIYTVTLTAYDRFGCSKTFTRANLVEVYEKPYAAFLPSAFSLKLPQNNISFQNLSTAVNPMTYDWNFGDPSSSNNTSTQQNPSHIYQDPGTYQIQLIVYNGLCYDTAYQTIVIEHPLPVASFRQLPDSGCVPHTVQFINESQFADSYEWFFGDGGRSTEESPSHTYTIPGTYTVMLLARGPGGLDDTVKSQVIKVYPLPTIRFFALQSTAFLPDARFDLVPATQGIANYLWIVTNADTRREVYRSNEQYPGFTINEPGQFDITLIARTEDGCVDSMTLTRYLRTDMDGAIVVPDAFTPNGDGKNDFFMPEMENVSDKDFHFRVYNRWGENVYSTNDQKAPWDGTFMGKFCQMDAYVWIVQGRFADGQFFSLDGVVTLAR